MEYGPSFYFQTAFKLLFDVMKELDLKLSTAADDGKIAIRLNNVILHQSKPSAVGKVRHFSLRRLYI